MNEIATLTEKQTMSSLEIATLSGKLHSHVMEAIRKMEPAWEKINQSKFRLVKYKDAKGEMRPCYELTKTECLYVATKFNDEARAKLVLRWEELEKKARAHMIALPDFTDPAEAAMAWAKEYNEKKALAIENKKLEEDNVQLALEGQGLQLLEGADRSGLWHECQGSEQEAGRDGHPAQRERPVDIVPALQGAWLRLEPLHRHHTCQWSP